MAAFSATEAAFAGFAILRSRPLAVVAWGAIYLVFSLVILGGIAAILGPQLAAIGRDPNTPPDPRQLATMMSVMLPFQFLLILATYAVRTVIQASAYRVVLRPDEGAPFNIGFGMAELFQLIVIVAMGLFVFVGIIAGLILAIPVIFGIAAAPEAARVWLGILCALLILSAAIYVSIRFSLAGPATFDARAIKIFESWTLTRGVFWPLFGAYLLAGAILLVAYGLVGIVMLILIVAAFAANPALAAAMSHPETLTPALFFGPLQILVLLIAIAISCLFGGFAYAMMYGPAAHAYRALASPQSPAAAF